MKPATIAAFAEIPQRPRARLTGIVYVLYFALAVLAAYLSSRKLVLYGDVANVIANACYVAVNVLLYRLFEPVDKGVSMFAALFGFVGCLIQTLRVFHVGWPSVSPFVFFGSYCILIGYLIWKSTFLPRFLGALMVLAGLGWLAFLATPIANANHVLAYVEIIGVLAEASLMIWLVFIGVDARRWAEADAYRRRSALR